MNVGRSWAYGGVTLGAVASVAANVAHSYVAPESASKGWSPEPGLVLVSALWPLALMIAVEVLVRSEWPDGWFSLSVRYGGVGAVAVVAAVVSYQHLSGLLRHYGETSTAVAIGPLAIDGLMLVCTAALLNNHDSTEPAPNDVGSTAGITAAEPVVEAVPTARAGSPVDPTAEPQSTNRPRSPSTKPRSTPPKSTGRPPTRTLDDLRSAVEQAIKVGQLSRPLTEKPIRDLFGIGAGNARILRDEFNDLDESTADTETENVRG